MRIIATLLVATATLAGVAQAQGHNVTQRLDAQKLARVFVDTKAGQKLAGQLLSVDGHNVTLLVDAQTIDVPFESVMRVQRAGDPVGNGARLGALMLGLWSAFAYRKADSGTLTCVVLTNAALGAAVGTGIDALTPGRTTLYTAPREPAAVPVAPRPFLRLQFRF